MNSTECSRESEVLKAAKYNQWTVDVRSHAASCPHCQTTITMTTMMNKLTNIDSTHTLPSYRLLWLKAQYARKQERLSKLDMVALGGMSLVGVAGFLGLLVWRFPKLFSSILETTGTSPIHWTSIMSNGTPLAVVVGAFVIIWLLTRDSFFAER